MHLHEITAERIAELEDTIKQNKPYWIAAIAALKLLEIELKKVMQQISDMKRVIREQHDYHFQLFTVAKNIEEAKEKRKQRLKETKKLRSSLKQLKRVNAPTKSGLRHKQQ